MRYGLSLHAHKYVTEFCYIHIYLNNMKSKMDHVMMHVADHDILFNCKF